MKNSLDELLAVLEEIRKEKHPEIPSSVIKGFKFPLFWKN